MYFDPLKASPEHKIQLYEVSRQVKNRIGCTWYVFFNDHVGLDVEEKYEDSLRKGSCSNANVTKIHAYIVKHYLALGIEHAPNMFDPSSLSNWDNFLEKNGVWGNADVRTLGEMGLTQQSDRRPISKTHVRLGQEFCFTLESDHDAGLMGFEAYKGEWYPMPLGVSDKALVTTIAEGAQDIPKHPETGDLIIMREDNDPGLHGYAFIIAKHAFLLTLQRHIPNILALDEKYLNRIVHECEKHDGTITLLRLNVLFK